MSRAPVQRSIFANFGAANLIAFLKLEAAWSRSIYGNVDDQNGRQSVRCMLLTIWVIMAIKIYADKVFVCQRTSEYNTLFS